MRQEASATDSGARGIAQAATRRVLNYSLVASRLRRSSARRGKVDGMQQYSASEGQVQQNRGFPAHSHFPKYENTVENNDHYMGNCVNHLAWYILQRYFISCLLFNFKSIEPIKFVFTSKNILYTEMYMLKYITIHYETSCCISA